METKKEEEKVVKVGRKVLHEYPDFLGQCERCKNVFPPALTFRWDAQIMRQDIGKRRHPEHSKWHTKMICTQCVGTLKGGARNGIPKLY